MTSTQNYQEFCERDLSNSLRLSKESVQFLEERTKKTLKALSRKRSGATTKGRVKRYSQRFNGEAAALLNALERRRWLKPEERRKFESSMKAPEVRIRLTAEYLAAIGQRS